MVGYHNNNLPTKKGVIQPPVTFYMFIVCQPFFPHITAGGFFFRPRVLGLGFFWGSPSSQRQQNPAGYEMPWKMRPKVWHRARTRKNTKKWLPGGFFWEGEWEKPLERTD